MARSAAETVEMSDYLKSLREAKQARDVAKLGQTMADFLKLASSLSMATFWLLYSATRGLYSGAAPFLEAVCFL